MTDARPQYEEVNITVETGEMLKRLADSLYPRPDVAIRELLANAVDSMLIKRDRVDRDEIPDDKRWHIEIHFNQMQSILTVADTGAGMTDQEVRDYINRIGASGTKQYADESKSRDVLRQLIGQFGIGLLACFKLGDNLTIVTRSVTQGDNMGTEWKSRGAEPKARMRRLQVPQTGTTITLQVSYEPNHDMLTKELHSLVRHYGDLLPFPIINNYGDPLNSYGKVPWESAGTEHSKLVPALKRYIVERARPERINDPLWVIPIRPTAKIAMAGVVYVPADPTFSNMNQSVDLYVRRMLVKKDLPGILPKSLFFCQGVVDCADLTMIMAREDVMRDATFDSFRTELELQVREGLEKLAAHQGDFEQVQACFDREIKAGVLQNDGLFSAMADAITFRIVGESQWQSLREYCAEAEKNRSDPATKSCIYYMSSISSPYEGHQVKTLLHQQKLKAIEIQALPARVTGEGDVEVPASLDRVVLEKFAAQRDKELVPATDAVKAFEDTGDADWQQVKNLFYNILPSKGDMELRVSGFAPADLPVLLRTEDVSKLAQRIKAMEHAVARFRTDDDSDNGVEGAADVLKAAQRQAVKEAQRVQVVLNSDNQVMQDLMQALNDAAYRRYDKQLKKAADIAAELYNLALQYSGYQASGPGMQQILTLRCSLVGDYLRLLRLDSDRQA